MVLGAAPVLPVCDDLFEIDDEGTWAILQPIAPDAETIVDIVAWHPCWPERWRVLRGDGVALGEQEIDLHDPERDGPLPVYATPLACLRADGRGVCLLRPTWQVAQDLLGTLPELVADTVELGARLDELLRYRPSPTILVDVDHDRCAA